MYADWEAAMRHFIDVAETEKNLGAVESAKVLLLHGMKAFAEIRSDTLTIEQQRGRILGIRARTSKLLARQGVHMPVTRRTKVKKPKDP